MTLNDYIQFRAKYCKTGKNKTTNSQWYDIKNCNKKKKQK